MKLGMLTALILVVALLPTLDASIEDKCQDTYFFIVQENWDFSSDDLDNIGVNRTFLSNYSSKCYAEGYSRQLPEKPKELIILPEEKQSCDLSVRDEFETTFPFIDISLGNISCEQAKSWNSFFLLENESSNYKIKEFRIWWVVGLIGLSIIFFFIRSTILTNKAIKKANKKL